MKRLALLREISRAARRAGLQLSIVRQGDQAELWQCGGTRFAVPRHREIVDSAAGVLFKDLEVELGRDWWRRGQREVRGARNLDPIDLRRKRLLAAGVATPAAIADFVANAAFIAGLLVLDLSSGGPRGVAVMVPDDDPVLAPAFELRSQREEEEDFDRLWSAGLPVSWEFLAHPGEPLSLLRCVVTARFQPSGPAWQHITRALLLDPFQLPAAALHRFTEPGSRILLVPEDVAARVAARPQPGNLYPDILPNALPLGIVPPGARIQPIEAALRCVEAWHASRLVGEKPHPRPLL